MTPTQQVARPPISSEDLHAHAGRWVAIRNGEVIAAAEQLADLRADERVDDNDAVYRVPAHPGYFF